MYGSERVKYTKEYIIWNISYTELHTGVKSEMAINDIQILLYAYWQEYIMYSCYSA